MDDDPLLEAGGGRPRGRDPVTTGSRLLNEDSTLLRVGLSAECVADCHRTAVEVVRQLVDGSL
ncbi:MAG: hypothetical protein M3R66_00070 [Actinomycetota bacterium]|nr:hypothetical protein [Actinomycetota bacterium]